MSSRLRALAESDTTASSASSVNREVSRAAVFARMVAMPSRRLSCSARWASVLATSALILARSSRTSRATTWNFVRTEDIAEPRSTAVSTSRTLRASTGMMPSLSMSRTRRWLRAGARRAVDWRWPRRATDSSSGVTGATAATAGAPHTVPRRGRWDVERSGPGSPSATWLVPTDLREIDERTDSPHAVEPTTITSMAGHSPPSRTRHSTSGWPAVGAETILAPTRAYVCNGVRSVALDAPVSPVQGLKTTLMVPSAFFWKLS